MSQDARLRRYVPIGLIILVAFVLRVVYLNERGLWYDEAFTILYSSRSFLEMLMGTITPVSGVASDVHPLFYYSSLHLWMQLTGDGAFAARFYSVIFGVATIPIVNILARDLFGRRVGIAAALIVAIAPFHLAYSQEARMYAQLGFWTALAFLAFIRMWRHAGRRWWYVFVLAGACSLYTHNLAFINFVVLGIWTIIETIRTRSIRLFLQTMIAGLTMIFLWLPWLVYVPSQFERVANAYWVPVPTLVTLLQTLLVFTFDFDNTAVPPLLLPALLFGTLILPIFLALETRRRWKTESRIVISFIVISALLPIALVFILSQWRPVYIIRAFMPSFLWYTIWLGWMFIGMPKLLRRALGLAYIAGIVVVLPLYFTYDNFPRSPYKKADAMLQTLLQPGDAIVHDNKLSFFPMYYYDRALPQFFLPDPEGAGSDTLMLPTQRALGIYETEFDSAVAGKSRVWFVIFQMAIDQAAEGGKIQGNMGKLDAVMWRAESIQVGDLRIYRYDHR